MRGKKHFLNLLAVSIVQGMTNEAQSIIPQVEDLFSSQLLVNSSYCFNNDVTFEKMVISIK